MDNIATGSDYVAFNQQLGIPSAEIRYVASKVSETFHEILPVCMYLQMGRWTLTCVRHIFLECITQCKYDHTTTQLEWIFVPFSIGLLRLPSLPLTSRHIPLRQTLHRPRFSNSPHGFTSHDAFGTRSSRQQTLTHESNKVCRETKFWSECLGWETWRCVDEV